MATIFVALGSVAYACFLGNATCAERAKNFYFLVSDSMHIQTSTHESQLLGGAGFLLSENDREYVALSVYLKEKEGNRACESLAKKTENAKLLTVRSEKLYFKGKSEKQKANVYIGAFDTLYSLISLLNDEIFRLDNGATQESSKRILTTLQRQFAYLSKEYREAFSQYASVCENANEVLVGIVEGIVYVKDLRYLLCELCTAYTDLSKNFSL